MTPEEYERYKEAEKQHLRKLKELKKAVRTLEREKSVRTAFEKVTEGQDLLDKQKDLVDRLAFETAQQEARLDVALDSHEEVARQENTAKLEEELQRERAQALVKQLEREMSEKTGEKREKRTIDEAASGEPAGSEGNPTRGRDDRPEKTIGRM